MTKFTKNSKKAYFWPILGPFSIFSEKSELSQKIRLPLLIPYASLTSCTLSRKTNDQIPRKVYYGQTNGQTQIHGTLQQDEGPKGKTPPASVKHISNLNEM